MIPRVEDTIVALASAAGAAARAIVRLSGSRAIPIAEHVFQTSFPQAERRLLQAQSSLPSAHATLPADVYLWPGPRTYTGQDVVEVHTIGSPPLVELLVAQFLNAGARAAHPGEFTMRAFLAGKLDLTRAEAVLAVIDAGSRSELTEALVQLAGGVTRPLQELREDLLNLLADVEAGLDFTEEDIHFVDADQLLQRIAKGLALVTLLRRQFDQRSVGQRPFRAVLVGKTNAGKSSLFNALVGNAKALVSPQPGTTRDYLIHKLEIDGVTLELVDTAGLRSSAGDVEAAAQTLGREQADRADLVVLCVETGVPVDTSCRVGGVFGTHPGGRVGSEDSTHPTQDCPALLEVATKCDLAPVGNGKKRTDRIETSAIKKTGLDELRRALSNKVRALHRPALAPSLSRCRHHVDMCLRNLQAAHHSVIHEEPAEILALELRGALEELGAMVGAVYTDDLLDRIFSRFCVGK